MGALVGILTDFGVADTYVGQVKAALWAKCPDARLVDLTHAIPPQDVTAGAFLLQASVAVFPAGSLFLAVVDPGVGSARRGVALRTRRGDLLIGPDNGLLVPAATRLGGVARAHALENAALFHATVSVTFHGRDVFAPVAGALAAGLPLERVGRRITDLVDSVRFPQPREEEGTWVGEVIHVDTYGNLITNLDAVLCTAGAVVTAATRAAPVVTHYQAVAAGEALALVGSFGTLEVSVRDGSAARTLGLGRGAAVILRGL